MSSFAEALHCAGFLPRSVPADGEWHRCPTTTKPHKRNGAFKLAADGRIGWFIDFASGQGVSSWRSDGGYVPAHVDHAAIAARRARDRAERQAALGRVQAYWREASPCRSLHPYLEAKGLSALGTAGLRERDGLLVVPVWWRGRLISVQTITKDGQKRFFPRCAVKGGAMVIARPNAALWAVCEGLATGLAVFQSVRHASVVVAFDCGNLGPATKALDLVGSVVFAADNDWRTEGKLGVNPGIRAAQQAAEAIGAGVAWPQGIEGSDWCDMLREYGCRAHKRIERAVLAGIRYVEGRL